MTDPTPAEALKAGEKPWGYYFWCSNGDGTSSPDFVKGEIPNYKRDVRNVVPLYTKPAPMRGEVRTESVAQALAKESGVSDWAHVSEHGEYDSRDYWRRLARASIAAIRKLP